MVRQQKAGIKRGVQNQTKFPLTEDGCWLDTVGKLVGGQAHDQVGTRLDTRPMRVFRTFYLVVLFSLSFGVFCGEIPEDLRLRDDTTNDYVNDSCMKAARDVETACKESIPAQRVAMKRTPTERTEVADSVEPVPPSGKELLPILSIRRT